MKSFFAFFVLLAVWLWPVTGAIVIPGPIYNPAAGGGGNTVTLDTSAKSATTSSIQSQTISITVASNSNRCLFVGTPSGETTLADRAVDSVSSSVNGAFTHLASSDADNANFCRTEWWYLIAPTAGAHTITVTYTSGGGNTATACACAISLYNVDQTTPCDSPATDSSTTVSTSTQSETLTAQQMMLGIIASDSNTSLTINTGTERQKTEGVITDMCFALATNAGSGSTSIQFTGVAPDNGYAFSVIRVKNQ